LKIEKNGRALRASFFNFQFPIFNFPTMHYPFEKLFLVCTGARCNAEERGVECGLNIRDALKDLNKTRGRKPIVRVASVSCLDLCDHGPNMVVHPSGNVYSHLTRELAEAAYEGEMGDGRFRGDLQLDDAEFRAGNSAAVRR
jgi:(2Fe-2S) ferredoxin